MSKFNTGAAKPRQKSPMTTTGTTTTYEGGQAWTRDDRSALLLLAVTNMVGEDTFYESAKNRDDRFAKLVHDVTAFHPVWMQSFIKWLRDGANMRSASVVAACEAVKELLDTKCHCGAPARMWSSSGDGWACEAHRGRMVLISPRQFINAACVRADEPGEVLAYWTSKYGRNIPKPVKRGVADAVARLYTERNWLKYDSAAKGYRFADVIDLTHPSADDAKPWQGDLFRHIITARHNRVNGIPESLGMVRRNALLRSEGETAHWLDPEMLREAGMTWEDVLSAKGSEIDKRALWEAMIPSMGAMALVRNLRNFEQAGISRKSVDQVCALIADPENVRKSRMFPYRMFTAYTQIQSDLFRQALNDALDAACQNLPVLDGRTLVLVDTSGSMGATVSARSVVRHVDIGALIGVALAAKGNAVDLFGFADGIFPHNIIKSGSVLRQCEDFTRKIGCVGYGTQTAMAIKASFNPGVHKRVVVVTDGQAFPSYTGVSDAVPADVPLFGIDTTGYSKTSIDASQPNRFEIGGFSDGMFKLLGLLASGKDGAWPWDVA